ncbi:MAG: universal stress protein [Pseudomonadaceae bacterium]|nr:universal stress protein [Pseudomonadaceae bacterium]
MQTVLIAGDGSAHADRAVAYLIGQIQQGGLLSDACAVHLLNVQPHLPSRISQGMSAEDLHAYYQGHSNDALMAAVAQLQQAGIGFTAHSRVGAPGASIVACAKELDCQSIIIGSHGAGLTLGSLLGSVASEVVRLSEVPVTLVK